MYPGEWGGAGTPAIPTAPSFRGVPRTLLSVKQCWVYTQAMCTQWAEKWKIWNASTEDFRIMEYFCNTSRHLESPLEKSPASKQDGPRRCTAKNPVELHDGFDIAKTCTFVTKSIKTNVIGILCWYGDPAYQLPLHPINVRAASIPTRSWTIRK